MFKRTREFIVSYHFLMFSGSTGFGSETFYIKKDKNQDVKTELERRIREENEFKSVVVLAVSEI